jgi:hypothetical protein
MTRRVLYHYATAADRNILFNFVALFEFRTWLVQLRERGADSTSLFDKKKVYLSANASLLIAMQHGPKVIKRLQL